MNDAHAQVIVIGAGIAGLTAAWQLQQSGIRVLVLEAEPIVGGRMQSIQIEDALCDYGAQFLSSAYSVIPTLIKEIGLSDEFVATNEWVGLVKNKDIALIHPRKPWHLISNKILSIWNLIYFGFNQFRFNFKNKYQPLNDITAWVSYDNQLASDWVVSNFGESVARELTSAIFNGFYFQSLNNSSASMAAAIAAFSVHNHKTMTLTTGMGSLPRKMAEQLNVRLNVSVSSIKETPTEVAIMTDIGKFKADRVILTVPAPIAKNIYQNPDAETLPLLDTPYSSSATISILTKNDWVPPAHIASVYGFLFNPEWNSKIAALTIENNKCPTRKINGYLVNAMLSDTCAKMIFHLTDEEIIEKIRSDIENVFPDIYRHLRTFKIFRWPFAMPCTPIGHATDVKQYRDSRKSNNRILLAGDYLGFPWTDSAAQTGIWAANQICKSFYTFINNGL